MKKWFFGLVIFFSMILGLSVFTYAQEPSFDVPIKKGWNLIPSIAPESIVSGSPIVWSDVKYAYFYIPHKKDYVMVLGGPDDKIDPVDSSTTINRREAEQVGKSSMWVYTEKEGSLVMRIDEEVAEAYFYPPKFELDAGWNFLWVTPYMVDKNLNDLKGDCSIEKMYSWLTEKQNWDSIELDEVSFNQNMLGQGLVVKASNNCVLNEAGGGITPPQMPN